LTDEELANDENLFHGNRHSEGSSEESEEEDQGMTIFSQPDYSQTTLRLYETVNFGQLLDAVDIVEEEQQRLKGKPDGPAKTKSTYKAQRLKEQNSRDSQHQSRRNPSKSKKRKSSQSTHTIASTSSTSKHKTRKLSAQKEELEDASAKSALPHGSLGPAKVVTPSQQQDLAKNAAKLASKATKDEDIMKRLLLGMTIRRLSKEKQNANTVPSRGHKITKGFVWASYPPLEAILKQNMEEYYKHSMQNRQKPVQHKFTLSLIGSVRRRAEELGWSFPHTFTDKELRVRIRCYYKTHMQNSKKVRTDKSPWFEC